MKRSQEYTEVKAKLESYCAYQERCTFEVKEKLKEFNLNELEVISIIDELKNDNYLNEERFARSYASGKFVIKSWGKIKIKSHLSAKKVSKDLIEAALNAIDYNEYNARLLYLSRKKEIELAKEKNSWTRKQKIIRYLVSKGFETHLIYEALGNHDAQ